MLLVAAVLLAVFVLPPPWSLAAIAAAGIVEIAELLFWVWLSQRGRVRAGPEALVGATAHVVSPCRPEGQVRLGSELWRARCVEGADPGARVRVVSLEGLTLVVQPLERPGAGREVHSTP